MCRILEFCTASSEAAKLRDLGRYDNIDGNESSGKKLRGWVVAAVMAWAAHHVGSTFVRMEIHMDASLTLMVQSEAHGAVGPVGVRRSTQVAEFSNPSR